MTHKDLFHMPTGPYFQSHSAGCLPKGSRAHLEEHYFGPWQDVPSRAWSKWMPALETFRQQIATLINTDAENICPQQNVSSGLSKLLFAIPDQPGRNEILLSEEDFPTAGFVLKQAEKRGWQLNFLPRGTDVTDPQIWLEAISDRTRMIFLTHVWSNSSRRAPAATVCKEARARDITSVVDVAQSAGSIPIDVAAWQADFVVGSCVKYSCGGPGAGWLYVAPKILSACYPIDTGWFSHEDPMEFDIHDFRAANNALRFQGGTPSVEPFVQAGFSLSVLNQIGIGEIFSHAQRKLDSLIDAVPSNLIRSETRPDRRGAMLCLTTSAPLLDRLAEAGIIHDTRRDVIRLSCHLYTGEDDIEALAHVICNG